MNKIIQLQHAQNVPKKWKNSQNEAFQWKKSSQKGKKKNSKKFLQKYGIVVSVDLKTPNTLFIKSILAIKGEPY